MSDFLVSPAAAVPQAANMGPVGPQLAVAKTADASAGTASSEYSDARQQQPPTELERRLALNFDDQRLTGPPPAFQASLLEVEADLGYLIKQIDAAREKARDEKALEPNATSPFPAGLTAELSLRQANIFTTPEMPYDTQSRVPVPAE